MISMNWVKDYIDIENENLDELADKAFSDQCTTANPRVPLVPEIKQILLDAYYGTEI